MAADARRAVALDQAVRRRDDGAGSRSRAGTHKKGLLLGAGARRSAVARRRTAGGGVQLLARARRRLRRGAAQGLQRCAANRRLCRLSRPRRSQARRRVSDARLLLGALAPAVLRPGQVAAGADRHRGPEADRRALRDRSRDPRQERRGAPRGSTGEDKAAGRGAEDLARDDPGPARQQLNDRSSPPLWSQPLGRAGPLP